MANTAVLWIRDGVLVDRMHINPVAFAFAVWVFSAPERRSETTLEGLVNFGFEKSGLSCADKMRLYNRERECIMVDVETAASYYNLLATEAASSTSYFNGAPELLRDLQNSGVQNFITSAVEQEVLDSWGHSQQGRKIAPYLREILGKRNQFSKGRDHFEYVSRNLGIKKIYYVADATAEIHSGKEFSENFNIVPIGFGNVITADRILEAVKLVSQAASVCPIDKGSCRSSVQEAQVDSDKIRLFAKHEIEMTLIEAGAESVVTGTREDIMQNLRRYFESRDLLQPRTASMEQ